MNDFEHMGHLWGYVQVHLRGYLPEPGLSKVRAEELGQDGDRRAIAN